MGSHQPRPDQRRQLVTGLLLVGALLLLIGFSEWLPWQLHFFSMLALVGIAALWIGSLVHRSCGPMLAYDLVRTARRGRLVLHRAFYIVLLATVLFLHYRSFFPTERVLSLANPGLIPIRDQARFAEEFFRAFLIVQAVAVLVMTPVYVAPAIAEEKQRRTLEFLLTTDLSEQEILFGILGARLAYVLLLLCAGLPVFAFMQFVGGIDPNIVLGSFGGMILLAVAVGSVGLSVSTRVQSPLWALVLTWVTVSGLSLVLVLGVPLLVTVVQAASLTLRFAGPECTLLVITSGYCLIVGCMSLLDALKQLRRRAFLADGDQVRLLIPQIPDPTAEDCFNPSDVMPARGIPIPGRWRPAVAEHALLWKELHCSQVVQLTEVINTALLGLYFPILAVCPLFVMAWMLRLDAESLITPALRTLNQASAGFCLLSFLAIAITAAASVVLEREQQTLDGLLTLPGSRGAVLFAKWWASILRLGRFGLAVGGVWIVAGIFGVLSLTALPLLALAWCVYAAFAACLGLWYSVRERTTLRALACTVGVGSAAFLGPGVLMQPLVESTSLTTATGAPTRTELFIKVTLIPVNTLSTLAFRGADFQGPRPVLTPAHLLAAMGGVLLYGILAAMLWWGALRAFEAERGPRPRR